MKHILLTGASGFLGHHIIHNKPSDWAITGLYNKHLPIYPNSSNLKTDVSQFSELALLFNTTHFDGVIHLAAISQPNYCQQHPDESYTTNVSASKHIARLCAEKNIPLVFSSSDLVFDGKKGNYTEADETNPISIYGEQKVQAEDIIKATYPDAAICRMPLMFGLNGGFMPGFLAKMKKGEALHLFTDEYRSVLGAISAAKGLIHALFNFKGLYHLGGTQCLSRYDFGLMMRDYLDVPTANIIPAKQADVALAAPRPANVSLNSNKAYTHGFKPLPAHIELSLLKNLV